MLRLGIIGAGGIASLHTNNILIGKCPEVQLKPPRVDSRNRAERCGFLRGQRFDCVRCL